MGAVGHFQQGDVIARIAGMAVNGVSLLWRGAVAAGAGQRTAPVTRRLDPADQADSLFAHGMVALIGGLSAQTIPLDRITGAGTGTGEGPVRWRVVLPSEVPAQLSVDSAAAFDFIIIDEAAFDCVEDMVDLCLSLRCRRPDVPLIIMSCSACRDDLSLERAPICDATLRAPASGTSFLAALAVAKANARARIARH
ncbi:MAG: hypothetical protein JJU19_12035 [Pararhodobacter sp.]|nr:hypothetical protein [Pararhodobacter sp.]